MIRSKWGKALIDILMVVGFIVVGVCSKKSDMTGHYWDSAHCMVSAWWFVLVCVHVAQHWRMVCSFTKKKVIQKNKITALTILVFIGMFVSIFSFAGIFGLSLLKFHHLIGRLFILIILIHTVDKYKRFVSFFK